MRHKDPGRGSHWNHSGDKMCILMAILSSCTFSSHQYMLDINISMVFIVEVLMFSTCWGVTVVNIFYISWSQYFHLRNDKYMVSP